MALKFAPSFVGGTSSQAIRVNPIRSGFGPLIAVAVTAIDTSDRVAKVTGNTPTKCRRPILAPYSCAILNDESLRLSPKSILPPISAQTFL
ncbi:MAG: hypothetical protein QW413_06055 [Nitrososphaerota archaeon]